MLSSAHCLGLCFYAVSDHAWLCVNWSYLASQNNRKLCRRCRIRSNITTLHYNAVADLDFMQFSGNFNNKITSWCPPESWHNPAKVLDAPLWCCITITIPQEPKRPLGNLMTNYLSHNFHWIQQFCIIIHLPLDWPKINAPLNSIIEEYRLNYLKYPKPLIGDSRLVELICDITKYWQLRHNSFPKNLLWGDSEAVSEAREPTRLQRKRSRQRKLTCCAFFFSLTDGHMAHGVSVTFHFTTFHLGFFP